MKLQINFDEKKITLADTCTAGKLMETLESLFPDGKWAEFTIETSSTINWQYPIIIKEEIYPNWPYNPYQPMPVWCGTNNPNPFRVTCTINTDQVSLRSDFPSGVYNLQFE